MRHRRELAVTQQHHTAFRCHICGNNLCSHVASLSCTCRRKQAGREAIGGDASPAASWTRSSSWSGMRSSRCRRTRAAGYITGGCSATPMAAAQAARGRPGGAVLGLRHEPPCTAVIETPALADGQSDPHSMASPWQTVCGTLAAVACASPATSASYQTTCNGTACSAADGHAPGRNDCSFIWLTNGV